MITVKDFYCLLFGMFNQYEFEHFFGELLSYREAGEKPLERRHAAYMAHIYLYEVMNEPDELSIEPAFMLKDIYECPSCIRHIAQVYLKGIMNGKDSLFGVRQPVEMDEAVKIAERTKHVSKRFMF